MPIGYSDAFQVLKRMKGNEAPKNWQGGLNITYKLGNAENEKFRLKMEIHSILEEKLVFLRYYNFK